jgi:hypothetical protein
VSAHDSVVVMCVQCSFGHGSTTASFDPSPSESSRCQSSRKPCRAWRSGWRDVSVCCVVHAARTTGLSLMTNSKKLWYCAYGIYPWVSTLVMEIEGRRFWVERGCFFLGGGGEGKRNSRARLPRRFRRTTRVPNCPVYVIYYVFRSGGFHCSMSSGHREGS